MDITPASSPTLRLDIRRSNSAGAVRQSDLPPGATASVATIKFDNAAFLLSGGVEFTGSGAVSISFPDPSTLQISVRPVSQRVVHGKVASIFPATLTLLHGIGVQLRAPSIALVGEMTQTMGFGDVSLRVVDSSDGCVLGASAASRPFALKAPLL